MSDEQIEQQGPSFEEALINRTAQRLGIAAVQIEALQLQVEQLQADNERLRGMLGAEAVVPEHTSNGVHEQEVAHG